jgi:hypothetical protein
MSEKIDEFRAVISGMKLTAEVAKNIEVKIRRVVLDEIAAMDLKGDYVVQPPGTGSQKGDAAIPVTWRGIVCVSQ